MQLSRMRLVALALVAAYALPSALAFSGLGTQDVEGAKSKNWGGLPDSIADRSMPLNTEAGGASFDEHVSPWVEQVSTHPKAYVFHNFLTEQERTHIIRLSAPLMKRSTVVGNEGDSVVDNIRTSYGMFINRLSDPIIARIERRISLFTHLPVSHQEDIQVLRYAVGQKYGAHYDSAGADSEPGPHWRLATFLMYLSDVEEGGETAFPEGSQWATPELAEAAKTAPFSDCAKGHVAAKPKAGSATLFYSFHPNGTMDPASMHTGCPVVKGIKWAAPVWVHVDEFEPLDYRFRERALTTTKVAYPQEPGLCTDSHDMCAEWAKKGECQKNKMFMMGNDDAVGQCRKSCGVCQECSGMDDIDCINANRQKLGYLKLDRSEMEWLGLKWWYGNEPSPEL